MTVHYRWPSWMSVKTTLGPEEEAKEEEAKKIEGLMS